MDLDYETFLLIQEEFKNDFEAAPKNTFLSDSALARQLQEQFEKELNPPGLGSSCTDSLLAQELQNQFKHEKAIENPTGNLVYNSKRKNKNNTKSLVDPSWEVVDPTPDVHVLFIAFNAKFFWGMLGSVSVSWSKRMKRCAGTCSYQGRGGLCHITLSEPLLKLRPRKDLVETLLHEMIHAYLFVTHDNRDRDGHGPQFHKHMYRINNEAGTNITVYHNFHEEVKLYQQHWWRCDGVCRNQKPFFGFVKRSSNRAPGPYDKWFAGHQRSCGGTFIKIKSPDPSLKENKKVKKPEVKPSNDLRKYLKVVDENVPSTSGIGNNKRKEGNLHTLSNSNSGLQVSVTIPSKSNNIHGFSNTGNSSIRGVKNNSSTIVVTKKPTQSEGKTLSQTDSKTLVPKTQEKVSEQNNTDYETVRNHWLNRFSDNKRKLPDNDLESSTKMPKLSQTSQDSYEFCKEVECPVCSKIFSIDDLNQHLDSCLDTNNKNNKSTKECLVCYNQIKEEEFGAHLNECLRKNFDDNNSECDVDSTKNFKSSNTDDEMNVNKIVCPSCDGEIEVDEVDYHFSHCCTKRKTDEENKNVMVDCLACGKKILKSGLNGHLDECLNEVFGDEESTDKCDKNDEIDDCFNCPCCMKLVKEDEMNEHIDKCLISDSNLEFEYSRSFE